MGMDQSVYIIKACQGLRDIYRNADMDIPRELLQQIGKTIHRRADESPLAARTHSKRQAIFSTSLRST